VPGNREPKFFYGYVVVAACFSIQVIVWGSVNTFGIFFKPLITEFGWSRATISGASSLASLLIGLVGIIAGVLNDRIGPRLVMAACGFFFGLGYALLSQINAIWQLYLFYGVLVGIGACATDVVLLSTIARWFAKRRGVMSGVTKVGTGLGILIMPLVEIKLIFSYGWRAAFFVLGALALAFIISVAQLLRRDPSQKGLLPNGGEAATTGSSDLAEEGLSLREAVCIREFWTTCAIYFTIVCFAMTILIHIAPHTIDLGISATNAARVLSTIGAVSMVGRVVMGNAGDRVGNKRAMSICFLILVGALSWLQMAKELWMLYLFAAVYGFSHGGLFALISPIVAGLFGTRVQGTLFGIVALCGTLGGAVSPLLVGYIFDVTHSYRLGFLLLIVLSIIGLVLTASLRPITGGGRVR
jgi:MFS family permease